MQRSPPQVKVPVKDVGPFRGGEGVREIWKIVGT